METQVLKYNEYIIGTYRDIKKYILLEINNCYQTDNEEWGEEYGNWLEDLIARVNTDKNVNEDTLICIKENIMGGLDYNVVELECI